MIKIIGTIAPEPKMLQPEEIRRYSRQILLPELGLSGQQRLLNSSVLVIGAGGLGSPALLYLAAAGIGTIGIVDFDKVDLSNLQRQILYKEEDVGKSKAVRSRDILRELNRQVNVISHEQMLSSDNAMETIGSYDVVIDGSDNLPTRYLVNDACVFSGKPLVYGAIFRFEGQVSVFNLQDEFGRRVPNYRDLFPQPPPPEMVPSCAEGGVMGVLPGIIGSMQANEAIKIVAGIGTTLSGRLMIFDSLDFTTRFLRIHPDPENPVSGNNPTLTQLIDYEEFCNPGKHTGKDHVPEISPSEVHDLLERGKPFQFIDVREPLEYQLVSIGAINLPLSSLPQQIGAIHRDGLVVLHCKSGQRSFSAARMLMKEYGFANVKNMTGGLMGWKQEVDPFLPV